MSDIELLPCPFCGGEATTMTDRTETNQYSTSIYCRRCMVKSKWFDGKTKNIAKKSASVSWNLRAK
jgi:Lar family restriction alleviation protein